MSKAPPGMHYCAEHQGNYAHYAKDNCALCRALSRAQATQNNEGSLPARQRVGADVASASGPSPESALNDTGETSNTLRQYKEFAAKLRAGDLFDEPLSWPNVSDQIHMAADTIDVLVALSERPEPGAAKVPERWKLVPVEPTSEMKLACCHELNGYMGTKGFTSWNQRMIQRSYHAMLAAAPSPSVNEEKPR